MTTKIIVTENQYDAIKNVSNAKKHITSFEALVSLVPQHIKDLLERLKENKENPKYHKEANTYEHIKLVTDQFINVPAEEQDIDLILAALYHDLGKEATKKPHPKVPGIYQSIGHENVSAKFVSQDAGFIQSMGGDPELIRNLVQNHMRYHQMSQMKSKKVADMEALSFYGKLKLLGAADDAGKA